MRDVTGWTEPEVLELFAAAKAALSNGGNISAWSSSGSSVSRLIDSPPSHVCAWCQWALRELNPSAYGGANVTRASVDFNQPRY
jgi:hypothetical protein